MHVILNAALILGLAAALGTATDADAQAQYPAKPVRIIVGFAPGGSTDVVARITALKLSEAWGQSVLVENRPGASGMIAAELVTRATPDGYTLLIAPQTSLAVAPSLYAKALYDPVRDFAPITIPGTGPMLLVVNNALPVKSLRDLAALAKARPGQLSYGSGGIGSGPHMAGELIASMAGIKMVHVPYKGEGPALTDVLGGQLPLMFSTLPAVLQHARAGRVRVLGITSKERFQHAAEFPPLSELGAPGFDAAVWLGLVAPAATPRDLIARIQADTVRVLSTPDGRERLASQGLELMPLTPEQFAVYLKAEHTKWAKIIRDAGLRAD